jgi:hypothetical protein
MLLNSLLELYLAPTAGHEVFSASPVAWFLSTMGEAHPCEPISMPSGGFPIIGLGPGPAAGVVCAIR